EIGRGDADVALEVREDDSVDAAEDVRKEVRERERQEDPHEQLRRRQLFLPIQRYRRLDQGPKGRAERPSLHDKSPIVERRSLHFALRAPVETTGNVIRSGIS